MTNIGLVIFLCASACSASAAVTSIKLVPLTRAQELAAVDKGEDARFADQRPPLNSKACVSNKRGWRYAFIGGWMVCNADTDWEWAPTHIPTCTMLADCLL